MRRREFFQSMLAAGLASSLPSAFAANKRLRIPAELPAVSLSGANIALTKAQLRELDGELYGRLLLPDTDGYDAARSIWNGMFDRKPALIAQCSGPADVVNAVKFARENSLLLAVRGGGHSIAGKSVCEGGMMLDLARMNGVRVDPQRKIARVEGGALLRGLDHESLPLGLATTAGTVSHTGAAGLTLGGGIGRLCRRFGLASDNLLSADIVTADGQFLHASAGENPELFWGLRGGGGNFGVVTSLEYQLHDFNDTVLGGALMYPLEQAGEVLKRVNDFSRKAHRELSLAGTMIMTPNGRGFAIISITYAGDLKRGARHLEPLLTWGNPLRNGVTEASYAKLQQSNDRTLSAGRKYYMKSGYVPELSSEFINDLVKRVEPSPQREVVVVMSQLGGAIRDLPADATAYAHRYGEFDLMIGAAWDKSEYSQSNVAWGRDYFSAVKDYTDGFYVNSLMDESESVIHENYRGNYPRLVALKNKYDPQNLFRMNANIRPTA